MGSQMLRSSSGRSPRWLRRKSKKTEPSCSPDVSDTEPEEYLSHSFVGSRGLQPSGLTHELGIFVGTWNVGRKSPVGSLAADLEEWLSLKSSVDIYVLGGKDVSNGNRNQGFTHIFESTFESTEAAAEYVAHEKHVLFVNRFHGYLEKVLIIDYKPTSFSL